MSRNKSKRPVKAQCRYPVQAIRDFFEHLLWEVRLSHYETHLAKPEVKPELVAKVAPYIRKYGAVLLPWIDLDDSNLTAEEREKFVVKINAEIRKKRDEQLLHLEAILPLLREALAQASGAPRLQLIRVSKPGVEPRVVNGER